MSATKEFAAYLEDLFSVLPGSKAKRMFGGVGVFRQGLMYALGSSQGEIALKADAQTIPDFQSEGCSEWLPEIEGRKPVSMGYWLVPERLIDDREALQIWAQKAFEAAIRADNQKPPKQRKFISAS